MRNLLVVLCWLIPLGVWGQTVEMPEKATAEVRWPCLIAVKITGAKTSDLVYDDAGMAVIREYDPDPNALRLQVFVREKGRYVFWVVAASADGKLAKAKCVVEAGGPAPPPPGPDPPPVPPPTPDAYAQQILAAYRMDVAAGTTAVDKGVLARFYRAAITDVNDRAVTTADALQKKLRVDLDKLLLGKLVTVRKVVWAELLARALPTESTVLTDDIRRAVAAIFTQTAQALEGIP